jgi:hypothetical protein
MSSRSSRRWPEWMLLLPSINLLEDRLPHEVSDPVEVIIPVDNTHQVIVVTPLDPASDGNLRQHLLPRLGQGGRRHRCNVKGGKHL